LKILKKKNLKYDIINKFNIKNTKQIPKLNKITLNIGCKSSDIKIVSASTLSLEIITNQHCSLTLSKKPNLRLKIRKNNPSGCKLVLRKNKMNSFIERLVADIFPNLKNFNGLIFKQTKEYNTFSYELNEPLAFEELEEHYYLFYKIPNIKLTLSSKKTLKKNVFVYILKSLHLTQKKTSKYNSIGRV
jgi:large subunit ribosomal protein L5